MALIGRLKMWLAALGAAIAAVGWAYLKGRKDADDSNELDDHNEYIATRKRMDSANYIDDDVTKWLRDRAKRDGNL